MKLYYSPFACSLAAHIACREAGLEFTLHRTELPTKRVEGAGELGEIRDLRALNPLGQVPTLVTDDDRVVMENSAVLTYIADHSAGAQLAPATDSFARYELMHWLSFVGTEVHKKCLWPIFAPGTPDAVKAFARETAPLALAVVEEQLATRESLLGTGFGVADAYLWWALTIMPFGQISLDAYPNLRAFHARHATRPAVVAAVSFERAQYKRAFEPSVAASHALP